MSISRSSDQLQHLKIITGLYSYQGQNKLHSVWKVRMFTKVNYTDFIIVFFYFLSFANRGHILPITVLVTLSLCPQMGKRSIPCKAIMAVMAHGVAAGS